MRADTDFAKVHNLVGDLGLHTVCKSARCPNIHECWGRNTATFMILGNLCTRTCRFCSVPAGRPLAVDRDEPRRVAAACKRMNLKHVVITMVTRDDLPDGGAAVFAETITAIHAEVPGIAVEVLTSDFQGRLNDVATVLEARPEVFSHNLETVPRMQAVIRPQASYGHSLAVLKFAGEWPRQTAVKSGIMVGLGETDDEVTGAMQDLFDNGVRLLTVGQYLQPTRGNRPVDRYVSPEIFRMYETRAKEIGFHGVASGPMVRSSYRADELLALARAAWREAPAAEPQAAVPA